MLVYDFDTLGIVYTAALGGLSLLMLIAMIRLIAKKKRSSAGTVFFRVIDFVLLAATLAVWCVYVLTKFRIFGVGVASAADGALALMLNDEVLIAIPQLGGLTEIWATALGIGLLALFSLLVLLDLVLSFALRRRRRVNSAMAEGTLLSKAEDQAEALPSDVSVSGQSRASAYDDIPQDGQNMLFERVRFGGEEAEADVIVTEAAEESIPISEVQSVETSENDVQAAEEVVDAEEVPPLTAEIVSEETDEIVLPDLAAEAAAPEESGNEATEALEVSPVQSPEEDITPPAAGEPTSELSEPTASETISAEPEYVVAEASEETPSDEPEDTNEEQVAEESEVSVPPAEEPAVAGQTSGGADAAAITGAPAADNVVKDAAVHQPGEAVYSDYVEVSRLGGNVSDKTYSSALQRPGEKRKEHKREEKTAAAAVPDESRSGEEKLAVKMPPLPVTRKLVITNRMNVVNMFNTYLNDKEKSERDKLSGSIGKIIIK